MDQVAKYLTGNTFKLYRASGLPFTDRLLKQNRETISTELAKFLYQIYKQNISTYEEDFVVRYNSCKDIHKEIRIISVSFEETRYLIIKSKNNRLLPRQTLVFSRYDNNTILLNRVTPNQDVNEFLLKMVQRLTDSLYVEYVFSSQLIPLLINKLLPYFGNDIRLIYNIQQTKLLNNIQIEVPYSDLKILRQSAQGLYTTICQFMYNSSKIKFDKLKIKRLVSDVINIASDGRIGFNPIVDDDDDDNKDNNNEGIGLLELIENIHSALNEVET